MSNPFVRKMENFVRLTPEERRTLEAAVEKTHHLASRKNIITEGDEPHVVNVVLQGWACRYKMLADGRRQIISLLLPGDMCDPHVFLLPVMDQSLGTLTAVVLAKVPGPTIRALADHSPALAEALNWEMLANAEIQREWTVSLGRRTALERLAHLLCEISIRMHATGLRNGTDCEFPLTQTDLADAMGLSTVHVNRTMQELRASGAVEVRSKRLVIHDRDRLEELAMFDPGYLHLRAGRAATLQPA
ncbi:MAG: Crp/Fnr family transcriptional regulator [Janthinobacterium lividum]